MSTFTKTTNEPTASNNKSDRTQVKICDTWKTLKYLNINENRKDVDRYKFVVLFLLIVVLFVCHIIYFFNNTIIVQVRYIIIETNEFSRIGYNVILFTHLGLHLSTHAEKETRYIQYGPLLLFQ